MLSAWREVLTAISPNNQWNFSRWDKIRKRNIPRFICQDSRVTVIYFPSFHSIYFRVEDFFGGLLSVRLSACSPCRPTRTHPSHHPVRSCLSACQDQHSAPTPECLAPDGERLEYVLSLSKVALQQGRVAVQNKTAFTHFASAAALWYSGQRSHTGRFKSMLTF